MNLLTVVGVLDRRPAGDLRAVRPVRGSGGRRTRTGSSRLGPGPGVPVGSAERPHDSRVTRQ